MISFVWLTFVSFFASDFFFMDFAAPRFVYDNCSIFIDYFFFPIPISQSIRWDKVFLYFEGIDLDQVCFFHTTRSVHMFFSIFFFITIIVTLLASEISMRLHKRQSDLQSIIGLEQSKPNDHNEARVWREKSDIRKYNKIQL